MEMSTRDERDLDVLFHRFNNAFIQELSLRFDGESLRLPYYLKARANDLQCLIRSLHVGATEHGIDYGVVDFVGAHLKPEIYETKMVDRNLPDYDSVLTQDYIMLFSRNALRGNVTHLEYEVRILHRNGFVLTLLFMP